MLKGKEGRGNNAAFPVTRQFILSRNHFIASYTILLLPILGSHVSVLTPSAPINSANAPLSEVCVAQCPRLALLCVTLSFALVSPFSLGWICLESITPSYFSMLPEGLYNAYFYLLSFKGFDSTLPVERVVDTLRLRRSPLKATKEIG